MVTEIHSQLARILKPGAPFPNMQILSSKGRKKFYFCFWQQTPSHIVPVENGISQPQTHWKFHNLILMLERWVAFDHKFHKPCQGKQEGSDHFWRNQLFHLSPKKEISVYRLFMSNSCVILWRKIKHITQIYAQILKGKKKRPKAQCLTISSTTLSCLTFHWEEIKELIVFIITFCKFSRG